MFVVSLAAYVIVNYLNIDKLIVVKNLERYEETGRLDKTIYLPYQVTRFRRLYAMIIKIFISY